VAQCSAPAVPAYLPSNRAPSAGELNAFATVVERYDGASGVYRSCLEGRLNNPSLSETDRRAALQAANVSAEQVGLLWDAYESATTRFRDHQAELARAASQPPVASPSP
jgi:hypothetical protein